MSLSTKITEEILSYLDASGKIFHTRNMYCMHDDELIEALKAIVQQELAKTQTADPAGVCEDMFEDLLKRVLTINHVTGEFIRAIEYYQKVFGKTKEKKS